MCSVLQQLRQIGSELEPPPPNDEDAWFEYRMSQIMLVAYLLEGRMPAFLQNAILWGQQVCDYCFQNDGDLAVCPDCRVATFCSKHQQQVLQAHRPACSLLAAHQR